MAVRIEDAGFEIRDMIAWVYGSGFPKSLDVSKAIDKAAGVERGTAYIAHNENKVFGEGKGKAAGVERTPGANLSDPPATDAARQWQGWGTALKPALEPITVARKPLVGTVASNVLAHGTGALNIDGCRVESPDGVPLFGNGRREAVSAYSNGLGCDGRTGETSTAGRWPANLIHDGSEEVLAGFPRSKSCSTPSAAKPEGAILRGARSQGAIYPGEDGSAARFFYCAKASKRDRDEGLEDFTPAKTNDGRKVDADNAYQRGATLRANTHPTVKPTDLMRYLCRLVTPPGGVVLDPFMGSGSTGKAALLEGFAFIGAEREQESFDTAAARIGFAGGARIIAEAEAAQMELI